ncbi:hypothetical protein [Pseudonocardia zijingensis]|jgi:hypothetical protein|uniref:non-specific serine/threonine protein kinase n=1 Tax=Pseudonocardia zijingensis TaxID=153376 RepID=A0ABP4AIX2_9PSEU
MVGSAQQFGPYLLDAVLARSGAATVYRARDTSHHERVVALKVFDRRLSADPGFRERFRRDAGLLSALREPHIVPIHRHGEISGRLYLDMRLVRGPSLADVLRSGPVAPPRAEAIAGQIGVAVESLRRGGLGDRPVERSDVLLTGAPGRGEFVQLVGLGLGRPPVPAGAVSPAELVSRPARHRRVRTLLVSAASVLVIAAVLVGVALFPRDQEPVAAAPPGLVLTIDAPVANLADAEVVRSGGREVLAGITADGALHTWDLSTGAEIGEATPGTAVALAATEVDGRAVVAVRLRDTTVVARDVETGEPIGQPMGTPREVALGPFSTWRALEVVEVDGQPVVVTVQPTGVRIPGPYSTEEDQIGVGSFALRTGAPAGPVLAEDGLSTSMFSLADVDGRPVVVTVTDQGTVQSRDLVSGARVGVPTAPQPAGFLAFTTTVRDGVPVAATGGGDNTVRIWNLQTGEQIGKPFVGHLDSVGGVAAVQQGDRTVLVTSSGGYRAAAPQLRFWDLATGEPLGQPLTEHPLSRGFLELSGGGRPLLATFAPGEAITLWDPERLIVEVAP